MPTLGPHGGVVFEVGGDLGNSEARVAFNLFNFGLRTVNPFWPAFLAHTGKRPNLGNP